MNEEKKGSSEFLSPFLSKKKKKKLKRTAETSASIPPSAQILHVDSDDLAAAATEADDERRPC